MSTQYDEIHKPYSSIRQSSIAFIEKDNVKDAVAPYIKDAKVLDLACGAGFYSFDFLDLGANSVLGIDISSAQIELARGVLASLSPNPPISFQSADCSVPSVYPGGPFDLAFGAWFLNYAPDRKTLSSMFKNISLNLKAGGRFFGILKPPTNDPQPYIEQERALRSSEKGGSGGLSLTISEMVDDGLKLAVHGKGKAGEVDFECFHLRKEVYEGAAREGGMKGEIKWKVTEIPEDFLGNEEVRGGASRDEIESYKMLPHYGMMIVEK